MYEPNRVERLFCSKVVYFLNLQASVFLDNSIKNFLALFQEQKEEEMAAEKVQQETETASEKVQAETEVVQEEDESNDAFELDEDEKSMIPTELKPLPDEQEFGPEMVIMSKY